MTATTPRPASTASPNNPHLQAPLYGSCHCTKTTYTLTQPPIRINCCHCCDCQLKSGSAFLTNAIIERSNVQVTSSVQPSTTDQADSPGVMISRCSSCYVALWSTIKSLGAEVLFVRAGTLEKCKEVRPDVHFFTRTKADWLTLPADVKQYDGGKPDSEPGFWTDEGRLRLEKVLGRKL